MPEQAIAVATKRRFRATNVVRSIREGLGMSQSVFAARFGFPIQTLRDWEQDISTPSGSARILLIVINHAPEVVLEAIDKIKPVKVS